MRLLGRHPLTIPSRVLITTVWCTGPPTLSIINKELLTSANVSYSRVHKITIGGPMVGQIGILRTQSH